MEPNIGTRMRVSPDLMGANQWKEGSVIDLERNPFKGLVIAIKGNDNQIYFGEAKYFIPV